MMVPASKAHDLEIIHSQAMLTVGITCFLSVTLHFTVAKKVHGFTHGKYQSAYPLRTPAMQALPEDMHEMLQRIEQTM